MTTATADYSEWTDASLIRQWWYLYARVLRQGGIGTSASREEFLAVDDAVAARGITKEGRPMPRKGAEDLADQCDEIRRRL